ncbi:MAG: ATP-binding protein [Myxococcota bacterium]|nr:ATP-binding protein [Myxococcota bacterium]
MANIIVEKTFERFNPSASAVFLTDGSDRLVLAAERGMPPGLVDQRRRIALSLPLPLTVAVRTGEGIWCETRESLIKQFPTVGGTDFPTQKLQAAVAIPFSIDHMVMGGLALSFAAERPFDVVEREVLLTIGDLAAHALDRSRLEKRFHTMHEAMPDGLGIFRPLPNERGTIHDFRYVYVNPVIVRQLGRPASELVGRTLLEVLPGLDKTPFWAAFCRVATTGKPETYEHPYGEHGWSGWFRNTVVSLGDEIAVTYSDISDRRRAEETLRFLAEASHILSTSLDYDSTLARVARLAVPTIADWTAIDMLSADGTLHRLAVAHVDPAKVELARDLHKRFPADMDAPTGVPNVLRTGKSELVADITDALLESAIQDRELLDIIRSLGLKSSMCVPLKAKGRPVGAMTLILAESGRRYGPDALDVAEDLARRASLAIENALLYRAAEEANQAKDDFLATVSHELRTPLNSILGWAVMLKERSLPEERQTRAIETIERNARAQNQLIEDLLDVSRIVSGKLRLDVEAVNLPQVVESAVEMVRPAATAKGIVLRVTVDPNAGPIMGDPGRIQQVVSNLLSNAVKFSAKEGGAVQVVVRRLDSSVEIVVRDKGEGIDPSFLPYVFERFRQADPRTTRVRGGLGLGLAIVRNLVELHGGTVGAYSEGIGRGAAFTILLPIAPVHSRSSEGPPALHQAVFAPGVQCPPELSGLHVLVVDDEADARDLVEALLTRCNLKVTTAANAEDALRLVQELRPDIVVSDIGLPKEDGYALIKSLRALPPNQGGRTPAVALTAYARMEDRTKALVAGFNMHVPKPVEPIELLAVLASLATTHRSMT